jgi:hypothetical protein
MPAIRPAFQKIIYLFVQLIYRLTVLGIQLIHDANGGNRHGHHDPQVPAYAGFHDICGIKG